MNLRRILLAAYTRLILYSVHSFIEKISEFSIFFRGFTRISCIFSHMTSREKMTLHKLARTVSSAGGEVFVEIGSYLGASATFIAAGICSPARLYCIDTWGNDHMRYIKDDTDSDLRDTFAEFSENIHAYEDRIFKIRKWSTDAIDDLLRLEHFIDFLFIDGDHNYKGCKADWDLYSRMLRPGSLVVFHDTGWAEGVIRVIKEDVPTKASLHKKLPNMQVFRMNRA